MPKIRYPKYKYSAYVLMGSDWKFLFSCNTEHQAQTNLRMRFGKDYVEHPEAYDVVKELWTQKHV